MKRLSTLLSLAAVILIAAFAVLNWPTLMVAAPLDLGVAQVQAPLGIVMLGMAGVLAALFFIAYLHNQIGTLLETRKLLKETQRVQNLADKAEASRIENLHQLIATEFRLLNEHLRSVVVATPHLGEVDTAAPHSLTDLVTRRERA